jgi:undecaprenyl pyrophosphate phosphatase UppP
MNSLNTIAQNAPGTLTQVGLKAIGALVLYLVGRALITWAVQFVQHALERQKVDPTLLRYVGTIGLFVTTRSFQPRQSRSRSTTETARHVGSRRDRARAVAL